MAIKKRPVSPRQKMINLMYVVLMAMLALNVSTEVLNGFSIVEESIRRTSANAAKENKVIYDNFEAQLKANPAKVKAWFDKAQTVKKMSDSLYNLAEELKLAIVREADGDDADVHNIIAKDNLEAANQVMLAPGRGRGGELFNAINSFRSRILAMVDDPEQKRQLRAEAKEEKQRYSQLKRLRWTLLANGARLPDEKAQRLQSILADHSDLAVCYAMKEELCALFELTDPLAAYDGWKRWFDAAEASGIPALVKFAELKRPRLDGLVAHAFFPISTGKLEGFNNKIKVAKRIGYGYRDDAYFFSLIRYLALPSIRSAVPKFP